MHLSKLLRTLYKNPLLELREGWERAGKIFGLLFLAQVGILIISLLHGVINTSEKLGFFGKIRGKIQVKPIVSKEEQERQTKALFEQVGIPPVLYAIIKGYAQDWFRPQYVVEFGPNPLKELNDVETLHYQTKVPTKIHSAQYFHSSDRSLLVLGSAWCLHFLDLNLKSRKDLVIRFVDRILVDPSGGGGKKYFVPIAFSPDATYITWVTAYDIYQRDSDYRLITDTVNFNTLRVHSRFAGGYSPRCVCAFSQNNRLFAVGQGDVIALYRLPDRYDNFDVLHDPFKFLELKEDGVMMRKLRFVSNSDYSLFVLTESIVHSRKGFNYAFPWRGCTWTMFWPHPLFNDDYIASETVFERASFVQCSDGRIVIAGKDQIFCIGDIDKIEDWERFNEIGDFELALSEEFSCDDIAFYNDQIIQLLTNESGYLVGHVVSFNLLKKKIEYVSPQITFGKRTTSDDKAHKRTDFAPRRKVFLTDSGHVVAINDRGGKKGHNAVVTIRGFQE